MNAITFKAAYSFFPLATFEERRNLANGYLHTRNSHLLEKYEERGWTTVIRIKASEQGNPSSSLRHEKRWTLDDKTWVLPLNVGDLGITDRAMVYDSVETTSFDVALHPDTYMTHIRFMVSRDAKLANLLFVTNITFARKLVLLSDAVAKIDLRYVNVTKEG